MILPSVNHPSINFDIHLYIYIYIYRPSYRNYINFNNRLRNFPRELDLLGPESGEKVGTLLKNLYSIFGIQ